MLNNIISLSRFYKKLIFVLVDSLSLALVILASFSVRLGYWYWPENNIMWILLVSPFIAIPIFMRFGLYHTIIRFIGFNALWEIIKAASLYSLVWGIVCLLAFSEGIPRSVIIINWFFSIIAIGGSRMIARWLIYEHLSQYSSHSKNVIIYGAGSAGRELSIALKESNVYRPIAFIDDNKEIHHQTINGLKVISKENLATVIEQKNVTEVLVAIPSLSRKKRNTILGFLESYPLAVRSLPSVSKLATGKVKINDLLEIDLSDLLGRDSVSPNIDLLRVNIHKKVVMVTGAGGSIGSELCRQIIFLKPKKIILFDHSESSLYNIEQELIKFNLNDIEIFPILGSVTNRSRLELICNHYEVQTIYHAAAYKHVPLVEGNPLEGIFNNVIGTLSTVDVAISSNVETFVLISTDKAVRPTSIMGASKRIAELILQAYSKKQNNTCLTMVRFGNVLDSSGSVIPLFKKQINAGGPITVTHPNVERYFMTIPEAVELVIQSGAMARGGEVFLLNMGEPIRIYDLALKMIHLSGLTLRNKENNDGDIEILFTGLRPGEKISEELLLHGNFDITENKLIMRAEEEMIDFNKLEPIIFQLKDAVIEGNVDKSLKLLTKLVPEFNTSIN